VGIQRDVSKRDIISNEQERLEIRSAGLCKPVWGI
jgi:hypothetical protein